MQNRECCRCAGAFHWCEKEERERGRRGGWIWEQGRSVNIQSSDSKVWRERAEQSSVGLEDPPALMAQSVNGVLYESLCLLCIHDSDVRSWLHATTRRFISPQTFHGTFLLLLSPPIFTNLFFFLFRALKRIFRIEAGRENFARNGGSSDLDYEEDEENRLTAEGEERFRLDDEDECSLGQSNEA